VTTAVRELRAVPHLAGARIDLEWQNPPADAFPPGLTLTGIRIVRRERTFPLDQDDGDRVYDGPAVTRFADIGLRPLTTYYYTIVAVDSGAGPGYHHDERSRASAFATRDYALTERLYRLLPAAYQRYDTPLSAAEMDRLARSNPAAVQALDALSPALRNRGQLRRFLSGAVSPLDLMRSFAEGLRQLHDADVVRPEFLPALASWLGWQLDSTLPVFSQRNEVKSAPRLYRSVGTVPNLRAIVTRYTGWYAQVAEFAEAIAHSNSPPRLNVHASLEDAGTWRGTDDAAPTLGFGASNNAAAGAAGSPPQPARLVGLAGPFALRPGMELAVTADERVPVVTRFQPGDFADMGRATAAEVAAVFRRTLFEVTAEAVAVAAGTAVQLRTHTTGPDASLRVEQYASSLVTLENSPRGRLATVPDPSPQLADRLRLFYEVADPLAPATDHAASRALSGPRFPRTPLPGEGVAPGIPGSGVDVVPSRSQGEIRYKTYRSGAWSESASLLAAGLGPAGEPAAVRLPSGVIWVAWVENPHTAASRLRFATGTVADAEPARLVGQRTGPFSLTAGARLLLRGPWPVVEGIELHASDFANPAQATPAEVQAALDARLVRFRASVAPSGAIALQTMEVGGEAQLEIDRRHSTAAEVLGFDAGNAVATGSWGDRVEWSAPVDVPAAPGRFADLHALVAADGSVWLFWAAHGGARWQIDAARFDGTTWSAVSTVSSPGATGDGREPFAVGVGSDIWLFWSQREGVARPASEDIWTLRRRVLSAAGWGPESAVTSLPPPGQRATDREPAATRLATGELRVFFRSDRGSGPDIWSVRVAPATGAVTAPAVVIAGTTADHWPAPVGMSGNALWLLFRSDRSVPLSRVATRALPPVDVRVVPRGSAPDRAGAAARQSMRLPDTGTLRRYAGSLSVVLSDAARNSRRRQWDDLLAYTPERPEVGGPGETLPEDVYYTRGTVGLFLSGSVPASPAVQDQKRERLRPVLGRFLPINVRAVVVLAPRVDVEFVYPPGTEIGERYQDEYPFVELAPRPADAAAAALPFAIIRSADLTEPLPLDVSVDADQATAFPRRTFFASASLEGPLMPKTDFVSQNLHGMYRDVVRNAQGTVTFDSGWRRNAIVADCRRLLAGFMRGAPATLGIQGLQVGAGLAAWDLDPGPPPAGPGQTALVDPQPFTVPPASLQIDFLQGGAATANPTDRLQVVATLGPGVPSWPDASHPTGTLREFGLVGRMEAAPVLINYVTHLSIVKDPASTLTRTIWLVF
jgi:phage tail-like protein